MLSPKNVTKMRNVSVASAKRRRGRRYRIPRLNADVHVTVFTSVTPVTGINVSPQGAVPAVEKAFDVVPEMPL